MAHLCPNICNLMDCSTPGFPVHHQLPELTQIHVHHIGEAIQPSHPLLSPSPPTFNLSQDQSFSDESVPRIRWPKYWSLSFSISQSFMNIQDWFPFGWTGWIFVLSKGLSRVFSRPQLKSINSSALSFLYGPTITSKHDYWKNHSFD